MKITNGAEQTPEESLKTELAEMRAAIAKRLNNPNFRPRDFGFIRTREHYEQNGEAWELPTPPDSSNYTRLGIYYASGRLKPPILQLQPLDQSYMISIESSPIENGGVAVDHFKLMEFSDPTDHKDKPKRAFFEGIHDFTPEQLDLVKTGLEQIAMAIGLVKPTEEALRDDPSKG